MNILDNTESIPVIPVYRDESGQKTIPKKPKFVITNYFTFTNEAVLKASPNPANEEVGITYEFSSPATNPNLVITDITGKKINMLNLSQEINIQVISTSVLQQGIYYLQLMDGNIRLKSVPLVVVH